MANQNVANMMHGAANQTAQLSNIFSMVMLNAETIAYNDVFRVCAIVFVISIPTVLLLKSPHGSGGTPEPTVIE
jgi:hypothetical protein